MGQHKIQITVISHGNILQNTVAISLIITAKDNYIYK